MNDYPWSKITRLIIEVIQLNHQQLEEDDWYFIQEEVEEWNIDQDWVIKLFDSILKKELNSAYIDFEELKNLTGFFAEIERNYLLNFEDYGEGIEWSLSNGMVLFISREDDKYIVKPLNKKVD